MLRTVTTGMTMAIALAGLLPPASAVAETLTVPTATTTYSVPASIDGTGKTDVSSGLQTFIDQVPNNSTIVFPTAARYRVERTLAFKDRIGLTFEGNGAMVFATTAGDRNRRHWTFAGGSQIVFRQLTVKGANPYAGTSDLAYNSTKEAQHGFDFAGVNGVELDRVVVTDVYGDFVYLGAFISRNLWTRNVWIHDSTFSRNGRQGIALTGASDVRIEGNTIGAVRRSTFDFEPNGSGWGVERVSITGNRIGTGRLNFVAAQGNGPVNDITIADNTLTGKAMLMTFRGSEVAMRHGIRVLRNTSDVGYGNAGYGVIGITWYQDIAVHGNVQRLQAGRGMVGVQASYVCNMDVSNNNFTNAVAEFRISVATSSCA